MRCAHIQTFHPFRSPETHPLWDAWFQRAYTADIRPYGNPPYLHHYVRSWQDLTSILTNQSLWASDIEGFADTTEYRHGVRTCFPALDAIADQPLFRPHVAMLKQALREKFRQRTFIACFSTEHDLETQWERYADAQRGFVLSFDARVISALTSLPPCRLIPVEYGNAVQRRRAERAVQRAVKDLGAAIRGRNRADVQWAIQARFTQLAVEMFFFCATFKDEAYRGEREWRLIYTRQNVEPGALPIRHRLANGRLVNYVTMDLTDRSINHDLPSFAAVRAGPKTDPKVAYLAREFLLDTKCQAAWEPQPPF